MKICGFAADPFSSPWGNIKTIIGNMQRNTYFNHLNNNSDHNLCTILKPHDGIGTLLRLGLKFCIQIRRSISSSVNESIGRFKRYVRLRYAFAGF